MPSLNLPLPNRRYKVIKELILGTFYIKCFDRTISNKLLADIQGTLLSDEGKKTHKNGTKDENAGREKIQVFINFITCF